MGRTWLECAVSDFLISIGKEYRAEELLAVLQQLYTPRRREGWSFDFPWGSLALLREAAAAEDNLVVTNEGVGGWVGDLVADSPGALVQALAARLAGPRNTGPGAASAAARDPLFDRLNGAFAIVTAGAAGLNVVTDPLGFTQVFAGQDRDGKTVALGTHADLVSVLSGSSEEVDSVSIAQLLLYGYCTFPHTMHARVKELHPGAVHTLNRTAGGVPQLGHASYWSPPAEVRAGGAGAEWARALQETFAVAVLDRCRQGRVGVALSGGLDSRLVMAAVPPERECIGLTLCDTVNREARTAREVAAAYGRSWQPLVRGADYVGDTLVDIVRLVGFECEFVHAHLFGFADQVMGQVSVLFTGDLLDTLLRAYTAHDFVRRPRLGGILPDTFEKVPFDYARLPPGFDSRILKSDTLEAVFERRRSRGEMSQCQERGSRAEWWKVYPFRHWVEVATWAAHRRVLPLRLVGADRRLLDFAFRCPVELKLGNRVFLQAGRGLYGRGSRVPSANDGVRPGSGHWSRLVQRALRKSRDATVRMLEKLGRKSPVEHSWHDYQTYWRQSRALARLIEEYEPRLAELDGRVFGSGTKGLLRRAGLHWCDGFRLLQLAVWRGLMHGYPQQFRRSTSRGTTAAPASRTEQEYDGPLGKITP
jgi:asparagine synthetase B (glutamine-hydrolysing)